VVPLELENHEVYLHTRLLMCSFQTGFPSAVSCGYHPMDNRRTSYVQLDQVACKPVGVQSMFLLHLPIDLAFFLEQVTVGEPMCFQEGDCEARGHLHNLQVVIHITSEASV
jgi:hypothetical protein